MSHGPGFGNSCIRRSVSSNRWPGSLWLLRICLGLYYIALSKEICHRKTVKGSFNPSPWEWHGSVLRLTSPSSPVPQTEPTGCLVGAQHCGAGFREWKEEASDLWHVRFGRANPRVGGVRHSHRTGLSQRGRTEGRAEGGVGKRFWSGRQGNGTQSCIHRRSMTCCHPRGIYLLQAGPL